MGWERPQEIGLTLAGVLGWASRKRCPLSGHCKIQTQGGALQAQEPLGQRLGVWQARCVLGNCLFSLARAQGTQRRILEEGSRKGCEVLTAKGFE